MELEFAFFDAQIQRSTADGRPKHSPSAYSAGPQSSSVQPGGEDDRDHGRFRGVHNSVSLLCVDFDDTLTDGDTTSLLVEAAKSQVRVGCNVRGVFSLWMLCVTACVFCLKTVPTRLKFAQLLALGCPVLC